MDEPVASPIASRGSSSPLFVVLIASFVLIVALFIAIIVADSIGQSQQLDHDAGALQTLLRHDLSTGATLSRTLGLLSSANVSRFLTAHGYVGPFPDLPFERVRSYDATVDSSQIFPGGSVLEAYVSQDWDRGIDLYFFYDRHGHLIRCAAQKYFNPALG